MAIPFHRSIAVAASLVILASAAHSDGADPMFDATGMPLGLMIVDQDVVDQYGRAFVALDMPEQYMRVFFPPEAVYVTIDQQNPVFRDRIVFQGGWVSTAGANEEPLLHCAEGYIIDPEGTNRARYGDATISYNLAANGDLQFDVQIGTCKEPVYPFASNYVANPSNDLDLQRNICGNEDDLNVRALGCSAMIAHPTIDAGDLGWAYWSRAYVRCGTVPATDSVADLMSAVRTDPVKWQSYFQQAGGYNGPIDGRPNADLNAAIHRYVAGECR